MQIGIFRHGPSDGLGLIAEALASHQIAYQYLDLYAAPCQEPVPDSDALIILGGSMSANDDLVFIRREIECIQAALSRGQPVLGICLGAQMIAKALGAKVYRAANKELGWARVTFSEAARNDALFRQCGPQAIFHWHKETFDLPPGAELLASSAACLHQAFRVGDCVYGLQFHLEVTPEMIVEWCREEAVCIAPELTESIDPRAYSGTAADLAQTVFGRWCDLVQTRWRTLKASGS